MVAGRARDAVEHAVQVHVLVRGQLLIQAGILEDDPEPAPDIRGVRDRIETVDLGWTRSSA